MISWRAGLMSAALMASAGAAWAQEPIDYLVKVEDPTSRLYNVEVELPATGDTTYVSLPSWTPGHYTLENYARYVRHFRAEDGERSLRWDKADKDTWRIYSAGATTIRIAYEYFADVTELSQSLLRDDFGFFNGTNLFVYPEKTYDLPARVRFELPEGWRVATELRETGEPDVYTAADYHQLVDNPTFVGHFAMDSAQADGRWIRLAVYPADVMSEAAFGTTLDALQRIADYAHDLFGEPPYPRYTTFVYAYSGQARSAGGLSRASAQSDAAKETRSASATPTRVAASSGPRRV